MKAFFLAVTQAQSALLLQAAGKQHRCKRRDNFGMLFSFLGAIQRKPYQVDRNILIFAPAFSKIKMLLKC
ncbi:hypothetical protein HMPREF3213_01840 [Heyndrickxia coagulans]|uniref:Uncharacterized protein n=1 Tax=Heyndrickxia coagulans TaxID=1398 RepID=A0A133KQM7_HEYCO|nr:hypothetical protein HMPREF3213_01840 [Heyndrickxia coagulans]